MSDLVTDQEVVELAAELSALHYENRVLRHELDAAMSASQWRGDPIRRALEEVHAECVQQEARYGADNATALDGTGPDVCWLQPVSYVPADAIESDFRRDYESRTGSITWMHLVREEIAESFKESAPDRLSAELIQVAALCTNWVAHIKARQS